MADDISSPNWNETAASNTTAGATGWAANSAPSSAYTVMRDKMAAIKRWYDRTNPTVTSAGTNTYTLTYGVTPNAYLQGDPYCFVVGATNTGPATLNVNALGAKAITKNGAVALSGGEMLIGAVVTCLFDGTQFQLTDGILAGTFVGGVLSATTSMSAVALNEADAGSIASSSTVAIGAAAGNSINITGTTGITAFDTVQAGTIRRLRFAGAVTLTHSASLFLPNNGKNITTAANDELEFLSLGSGNWKCTDYQPAAGEIRAVRKQSFTGSGTYTPDAHMVYSVIESIGPGGGGGGCQSGFAAGGGGAGQWSRVVATAATVGASQVVTIATGGAGGSTSGTNGSAGSGNTSVGTLCTAAPGQGGTGATGFGTALGGLGGSGGTSDVATTGASGISGNSASGSVQISGNGGSTPWGGGGVGNGVAGTGFGSGGSGGNSGAKAGGAGTNGVVYITEYCSQ